MSHLQHSRLVTAGLVSGTSALVTGAAGFIGSHLAQRLVRAGVAVTGLDCRPLPDRKWEPGLASPTVPSGLEFVQADLRTADLRSLLRPGMTVFHLAAIAGVRPSWGQLFPEYLSVNVEATQRLLEACQAERVPTVVLASSSSVYGPATSGPVNEAVRTRPASPYGVTKLAAEQLALSYAARLDSLTRVTALRFFSVYGPRQRPDMWISRVLSAALTGQPIHVHGDGRQRRDFTFVDDVVDACLSAAAYAGDHDVFNIGTGRSVGLTEVIDTAQELAGHPIRVVHGRPAAGDVAATHADIGLAQAELAYCPATDLRTGMAQQWEWLTGARPAANSPLGDSSRPADRRLAGTDPSTSSFTGSVVA